MDVGLNKCPFDYVGLKDNVRRSAYLFLLWDVSSSLSQRLSDLIATVGISKIYFCAVPRLSILLFPNCLSCTCTGPWWWLVVGRLLIGDDNAPVVLVLRGGCAAPFTKKVQ